MKEFNEKLQERFAAMCKSGKLFRSTITGRELWTLYLESFKNDPIFRDPNSSTHNCNHCNNFIKRYGNIVGIDADYNIITMFDVDVKNISEEYVPIAKALSTLLKKSSISNVFFETFNELNELPYEKCSKTNAQFRLGVDQNVKRYTKEEAEVFGVVKPNEIRTFNHFHLDLPKAFVDMTGESIETIMANFRTDKEVFKRAMDEISSDTFNLVFDLIKQGSLLNGDAHLTKIEKMVPYKAEYDALAKKQQDNWCWVTSYKLPIAKFRNELIGTLCSELSQGEDLNTACQSWNKRVDPANYMKATAPITQSQIKAAQKFVEENGYTKSFRRRIATIDDIKVTEIKHINSGNGTIEEVSIFDKVKPNKSRHQRNQFDNIEEISIVKFMKDVLPTATSVEAFLDNKHEGNMVTLTTSETDDSKPMFKWDNNYSWTYNGNLAGKSQIKEAVKDQGGIVDGVLNFRLAWNDGDGGDTSDLDIWASEPGGLLIGYSTGYRKDSGNVRTPQSGQLDVDNRNPGNKMGVENITWNNKAKMKNGVYKLWINQFSARNSKGFKVEIEFGGDIYEYTYDRPVHGNVQVAEVTLKDGEFTINHILPSISSSKTIYGLDTKQFHRVNLMCLSPNHWDNNKTGNQHYFFMLDKCKTDRRIRSFHNENLNSDLVQHKKVMEVLGATNMVDPQDEQLSGLGFNATVPDELIVKVSGTHKRMMKIKF